MVYQQLQDLLAIFQDACVLTEHSLSKCFKVSFLFQELEILKERLETQEMTWKINLTDAQKDADQTKRQVGIVMDVDFS